MSRFGKHGFAGPQGCFQISHRLDGPRMKSVAPVEQGNERAGVDNRFHAFDFLRRPKSARCFLFVERSGGPSMIPAYFNSPLEGLAPAACSRSRKASRT